jgi:hypothetical protein
MTAGHSGKSQKPAGILRNHLLACSGIGCWLPAEWGAGMLRNRVLVCSGFSTYFFRSTTSRDLSLLNHHIISNTGQCYDLDYIRDAAFDGTITFDRMGLGELDGLVFGCKTQFAVVMPINLYA